MFAAVLDVNILIFVALMLTFAGGGHLLATRSRFFRDAVHQRLASERYESHLDGLRGLAAFAVFVHHGAYIWLDMATGGWRTPESHFMDLLGGAGVSMFFFLSGYLFWSSFLHQGPGPFSAARFYKQRLFRIAPVHWLFCCVMVVMVLWDASGALRTSVGEFVGSVVQWLTFGVPLGLFPDVNGFPLTRLINGDVAWSLRHEVLFYLLLPCLLPLARHNRTPWMLALFVATFVVFTLVHRFASNTLLAAEAGSSATLALRVLKEGWLEFNKFLITGFAPGIATAYVLYHPTYRTWVARIQTRHAFWAVCVCCLLLLLNHDPRFSFLKLIPLSIIFFLVAAQKVGTDLLRMRGLMVLGLVSYSVYVFHGVFLFALQPQGLGLYQAMGKSGLPAYWVLIGATGLLVLAVSALLFRFVEAPCIAWGKRSQ